MERHHPDAVSIKFGIISFNEIRMVAEGLDNIKAGKFLC